MWTVCLAAIVAGPMYLRREREPLPPIVEPPWIPLPETGMDASRREVRDLIQFSRFAFEDDPRRNLSASCGRFEDEEPQRYRLTISRDAWRDFRQILIVPHGEWLEVSVRDALPPPPPSQDDPSVERVEIHPMKRVRLHKRDAEPIRLAWNTPSLWHAAQDSLGCMDGRMLVLEACVAGRYAIRQRACGIEAAGPAQELWKAVTTLLPEPEKAYYRER